MSVDFFESVEDCPLAPYKTPGFFSSDASNVSIKELHSSGYNAPSLEYKNILPYWLDCAGCGLAACNCSLASLKLSKVPLSVFNL